MSVVLASRKPFSVWIVWPAKIATSITAGTVLAVANVEWMNKMTFVASVGSVQIVWAVFAMAVASAKAVGNWS